MRINVTQEHIDKGNSSPRCCPIALALLDQGYKRPYVSQWSVWTDAPPGFAELSRRAHSFVRRFDNGQSVEPFSFDLDMEP